MGTFFNVFLLDSLNTRIYNLSSGPYITRFSAVFAEKFQINLSFETSEQSVQITADDNSKFLHKYLK